MPQVTVEVGGRAYRLSCGDGEQEHVIALARRIDKFASQVQGSKSPTNEGRNMLMAALMVADELHDRDERLTALEKEVADLKASGAGGAPDERIAEMETAVAEMLDRAAAQIESATAEIEGVS